MTIPTGTPPTERPTWLRSGLWVGGFVAFLYVVEIIDRILPANFENAGIEPRTGDGLWGILFAPILHGDWTHLTANTVPALVLGFLVLLSSGITRGIVATAVIWVVAGVGTWLFAGSGENHIGASSLIFGWLTYLIIRGIFTRKAGRSCSDSSYCSSTAECCGESSPATRSCRGKDTSSGRSVVSSRHGCSRPTRAGHGRSRQPIRCAELSDRGHVRAG